MVEEMIRSPLLNKNDISNSSDNVPSINGKSDIEGGRNIDRQSFLEQQQYHGDENLENPIDRYNEVIDQYNNPLNKVDDIELVKLNSSPLVGWVNKLFLQTSSKIILVFLFLIASGINILVLIIFLIAFGVYLSNYHIYIKDQKKVPDPFVKMIFCEEICESLNVSTYYFKIDVNHMANFSFNFDTMNFIKERIANQSVEFMVYDIKFYENYTQFAKVRGRFLRWILVSIILIAINMLAFFLIFDYDLESKV